MRVNAERLLRARKDAGLSREKLGRKIGLSAQSVWRTETCRTVPGANAIGAWAEACGVGVETLYDDGEHDTEAA